MYAGGVNFTSFFFMNVYRIYVSLVFILCKKKGENIFLCPFVDFCCLTKGGENFFLSLFLPLCWCIDKKGEKYLSLYMHAYFISLLFKCIYVFFMQKGEVVFGFAYDYFLIYASLCWAFIAYLFVSCYAWVKGKLLWSLTLIHAYITPWVLSSSKSGRLLAQRPSTLVLMMIN